MSTSSILKRFTPFLSALVCLLAPLQSLAEQQTYTAPQVISYALKHNGDINAFREEKGIREAARTRSGLYPNPAFEFDGSTGALTGSRPESTLSFGLSQEFLTAGRTGKRLQVVEHELDIYSFQLADRERLLVEELLTTFYGVLLADKRRELADRSIALNRNLLDIAGQRLAAGDIPELELNLVRVELARSEGKRIELQRESIVARSRLFTLMGMPYGETAGISGTFEASTGLAPLPELIPSALTRRPDVRALAAGRSKGNVEIALAQAEGIPNLTAGIAFIRDTTAGEAGRTEENYQIGLKLSVPIPLFDRNQAGIQEAHSRKSSAELRYQEARNSIEREIEAAYSQLHSADAVVALYSRDIIPQLEENLKLTQEAYRLGELGILSVIDEQKKFFEINDSYLSAQHSRRVALIRLETAVAAEHTGGVQ